jgi:hypothetical protein
VRPYRHDSLRRSGKHRHGHLADLQDLGRAINAVEEEIREMKEPPSRSIETPGHLPEALFASRAKRSGDRLAMINQLDRILNSLTALHAEADRLIDDYAMMWEPTARYRS